MEKAQYIIVENNIKKRREFYNYIMDNYKLKTYGKDEAYINNIFPFVVDFKAKKFWICDSVKLCGMAVQYKKTMTMDEFMEKMSK